MQYIHNFQAFMKREERNAKTGFYFARIKMCLGTQSWVYTAL